MKIIQKDGSTVDWPAGKPLPDGARVAWDLMRDAASIEAIAGNTALTDADRSYASGYLKALRDQRSDLTSVSESQAAYEKALTEAWR